MRTLRRCLLVGTAAVAAAALATASVTVASGLWLRAAADGHVHTVEEVPAAPVALVLGAQVFPDGRPSAFLEARLEKARRLFAAGTVRAILVSGDHREHTYDEPGAMTRWLVAHGVPRDRVVQDHAGLDTYDSCVRARDVFGVDRLIVITQRYHIDRAVALCRHAGIDADGVPDDTARQYWVAWDRGERRERLARVKAVYDVLSGRDPVFLGPHESGVDEALRT